MTLERLKEIFPQENITTDTTVGEIMDFTNLNLSLQDSKIVEWDEMDTWIGAALDQRATLFSSIEHYLTP